MIGTAALAAVSGRLAGWAPGLIKALAFVGALALVFGSGYFYGRDAAVDKAQAQAKRQADAALVQFRADVAAGEKRTAEFFGRLQELVINGNTLTERLASNATPLTVIRSGANTSACLRPALVSAGPRADVVAGAAAIDGPGLRPGGAATGRASADSAPTDAPLPDPGVGLTLGAVSLWNSALAGVGMPAGACGADGRPEPACAADAGLDVTDAWRNHVVNAGLCAQDRERLRQLTEHLKATRRSKDLAR